MTTTKCFNCKHVLYDYVTLTGMELDFDTKKYCSIQNLANCDEVNDGNCLFFKKASIIPDIILVILIAFIPVSIITTICICS